MAKKILLSVIIFVILIMVGLRFVVWLALSGDISTKETIYSFVCDECDKPINISQIYGGATDSDYIQVTRDGRILFSEKISGDVTVESVYLNDSLHVIFADSLYFPKYKEYRKNISVNLFQ